MAIFTPHVRPAGVMPSVSDILLKSKNECSHPQPPQCKAHFPEVLGKYFTIPVKRNYDI